MRCKKTVRDNADARQQIASPIEAMFLSGSFRSGTVHRNGSGGAGATNVAGRRRSNNSGSRRISLRPAPSTSGRRKLLLHPRYIPEHAQHGICIGLAPSGTAAER